MRAKRLLVAAMLGGIVAAAGCKTCESCKSGKYGGDGAYSGVGTGSPPPSAGAMAGLYGGQPAAGTGTGTGTMAQTPAGGPTGTAQPAGAFGGVGR